MHARHYSPALGRFLQPDPDRSEANLYAYAANNPVTEMDPDGTCFIVCAIVGAAVNVAIYAATTDDFDLAEAAGEAVVGGALGMTGVGLLAKVASGAKLLSKISKANRVTKSISRFSRSADRLAARHVARGAMKATLRFSKVLKWVSPEFGVKVARRAGWKVDTLRKGSARGRVVSLQLV